MPAKKKTSPKSVSQDEVICSALAYIGILFLVPLIVAKDSKFALYHANQGLVLFLAELAAFFVAFILTPVLIGFLLWPLIWLAGIIMLIIGIMNVAAKQMKPLPVIGKITLIK